jgi:polyisoprenyl-phosphate glycosyltransferase
MKESSFVSAVLYVRNEQDYIQQMLGTLNQVLRENFLEYEIICVNDSSTAESPEYINQFAKDSEATITMISMGYYQGLESSMSAGVDLAIGDFVFEFDNHNFIFVPSLIMDLYSRCLEGYDIVNASRGTSDGTSILFYKLFNSYSNVHYPLVSEDFRVISRRAINRVQQMSKVTAYRKAIYASCGLKNDIIFYELKEKGTKKIDKEENAFRRKLAIDSFVLFTDIAYKISFFLSTLMLSISLIAIIYTLIIFFNGHPVLGWTTTMLMLSVGMFGIFAVLTFVIKYLSIILTLVFENKKYVIENIEKLQ